MFSNFVPVQSCVKECFCYFLDFDNFCILNLENVIAFV